MEPISEGRAQEPTTAGAWLRNARQQRGLHIAALAVMLKVPQAKLEALEGDRFTELPDATFARALATAVCRALKVDPGPVLALLPRTSELGFDVRPGLNQPFRERGAGPIDGGLLSLLKRPVVWGLGLLLIVAAAIYWVPAGWLPESEPTPAFPPAALPASGVVTSAASAPVEFIPAPLAASEPVLSAPPVVAASAPAVVASAPLTSPTTTGSPALRVTATADSWIEVIDAKGQTLLSRVLRQGEQQDFSGAAPYKLRVGNVSGTQIEWRGSSYDLQARASNNVARVELN